MNLKSEIALIKLELDKVEDQYLVEAIKNLLAFSKSKIHEDLLIPMSTDDFLQRQELSRKDIAENNLISQEKAKAYFANKFNKKVE